jgi:hypothetical protein
MYRHSPAKSDTCRHAARQCRHQPSPPCHMRQHAHAIKGVSDIVGYDTGSACTRFLSVGRPEEALIRTPHEISRVQVNGIVDIDIAEIRQGEERRTICIVHHIHTTKSIDFIRIQTACAQDQNADSEFDRRLLSTASPCVSCHSPARGILDDRKHREKPHMARVSMLRFKARTE